MALINVEQLVKVYSVTTKKPGLKGAVRGLFAPERKIVTAVDDISFSVNAGEIVGYLGRNGAGKSTTIKILTGVLHPTSGSVQIGGLSPQLNRKAVVKQIGVVFGQRSQLYWDLRLGESFELLKRMYRVDSQTYQANLRLISDTLELGPLIDTPVRQLSLGQRMRGELAAAVLHSPAILFLDEPTIGLDIEAKQAIRAFILDMNRRHGTTIILTTHDLDDVEQLCQRLIVIDNGKVVRDGALNALIQALAPYRTLVVDFQTSTGEISHPRAVAVQQEGLQCSIVFDQSRVSVAELINDLARHAAIRDLRIKEPDIEAMIKHIYNTTVMD